MQDFFGASSHLYTGRNSLYTGGGIFLPGRDQELEPFNPARMVYHPDKSFSTASQETLPTGFDFTPDFTKMILTGTSSDFLHTYTGITATDLSTATYDAAQSSTYGAGTTNPTGHKFLVSGTKVAATFLSNDDVNIYTTASAYNFGSKTYQAGQSTDVSTQQADPRGVGFNTAENLMLVVGSNNIIYAYDLSTPGNPSTKTYNSAKNFDMTAFCGAAQSVQFINNETALLVTDSTNAMIHYIELATAGNPSTGTYRADKSLSVIDIDTLPQDATFNADGTAMYMLGAQNARVYAFFLTQYSRSEVSLLSYIPGAQHAAIANNTTVYDATADFATFTAALSTGGKNGYAPAGTYVIDQQAAAYTWFGKLTLRGDGPTSIVKRPAATISTNDERLLRLQSYRGTVVLQDLQVNSQQSTQSLGDAANFEANFQRCHDISIMALDPPNNDSGINVYVNNLTFSNPIGAGVSVVRSGSGFCNVFQVRRLIGSGRPYFRGDVEITCPYNLFDVDGEGGTFNSVVSEVTGVPDFTKDNTARYSNFTAKTMDFTHDCTYETTPKVPTLYAENCNVEVFGNNGGVYHITNVNVSSASEHCQLSKCHAIITNMTVNITAALNAAIDFGYLYKLDVNGLTVTGNCTYAIEDQNEQTSTSYMKIEGLVTDKQVRIRSGEYEFKNCTLTYAGPGACIYQVNSNRANMGTKQNSISLVNNYHPNADLYEWDGNGDDPNLTESGNYQ